MKANCSYKPDFQTMKASIADLIKPNPFIYWFDFILTIIFSWGLFYLATKIPYTNVFCYLLVFLSAIGFYRAVAFTHELVHLRKGAVPGFSLIWHVLCGIPLLAPHFLYRSIHVAHHNKKNYGKESDGEYIGFGTSSRWLIVAHLLYNFLIPLLSILRFMVLTPLSFCNTKLRLFVMENMSFMGLRFSFSRKIPTKESEVINWYIAEFSCCLLCWFIFIPLIINIISIIFLYQWYIIMISVLTLNSLRSLGATHWYTSKGVDLDFTEQIRDSVSIKSKSLFTKILCPVGTQYHSLHHMFPSVPYHALGNVYEHLIASFPEEEILNETSREKLILSWKEIWSLPRNKS